MNNLAHQASVSSFLMKCSFPLNLFHCTFKHKCISHGFNVTEHGIVHNGELEGKLYVFLRS